MVEAALKTDHLDEEVLILAPTGQDARLIAQALMRESIHAFSFADVDSLIARLEADAGALILAEEALMPPVIEKINQLLAKQEPWSDLPVIIMTTSGETTLSSVRVLRAFSSRGSVTLLERPFRPITLVSMLQVALRSRRRQYQVRTLLQSQLAATRARDEFISVASHELKTPLTSLKLQAQMSQRYMRTHTTGTIPPERVTRLIDTTQSQVDRLTRLVEDMLDVSRISSGKLAIVRSRFDLAEMVEKHVDFFRQQCREAGCELSLKSSEPVIGGWDRFRLEQVLSNLLSNAVRYSPGKPIQVVVTRVGAKARLTVRDEGPGIAREDQQRIFERFERVSASGYNRGLGLGLYISREIVLAHGGTLDVESELGRGSTFTVELPL